MSVTLAHNIERAIKIGNSKEKALLPAKKKGNRTNRLCVCFFVAPLSSSTLL
jgi:hypothetical protein